MSDDIETEPDFEPAPTESMATLRTALAAETAKREALEARNLEAEVSALNFALGQANAAHAETRQKLEALQSMLDPLRHAEDELSSTRQRLERVEGALETARHIVETDMPYRAPEQMGECFRLLRDALNSTPTEEDT